MSAPKEPVARTSADPNADRVAQLRTLFPEAFADGKLDPDKLRAAVGENVAAGPERFTFSWAGRSDAAAVLQTPTRATLVPAPDESVDFDTTKNLFVEGDNLEVLKLLYKPYHGRVKLIYIDPPYNTGNDFIYPDDFRDTLANYLALTGQSDEAGNLLRSNPETGGRYHSDWLSMMWPRLFLARQLLRDDGVIFVSIDDHEVHHLRLLMNEVFGEENHVATLVWEKGRKNDAKLFSVGHEYILVFARSATSLRESETIWREAKPGAAELWKKYEQLKVQYRDDCETMQTNIVAWFKSWPAEHPSKTLSRHKHIDKHGPWRDRDISWPGGGGPRYDVIHPLTKQPCKVPDSGWRFSTIEAMQRQIDLGMVEFRADHSEPPFRKAHLRPPTDESSECDSDCTSDETDVGLQVMPSVIYKQSQVAIKQFVKLMGGKLFDNPKDHEVLSRLLRYCGSPQRDDIVLDFFAGSGTTAQTVLELNREDGGNRRFILVQLPEPTKNKQYPTIAEIGKERVRRVIDKLKNATGNLTRTEPEDLGFKVFRLAESHFTGWAGVEERTPEAYNRQLRILVDDPLRKGWTPTGLLWEIAVKEGYGLNSVIDTVPAAGATVHRVTDPEKGQRFLACLGDTLPADICKQLGLSADDLFVVRDSALDDTLAANLALQCRLKTI